MPVTSPAPSAAPASASVFEDFIDIFYAPSEVFTRRRDGRFGLALLVLTIAAGVLMFVSSPLMNAVFDAEYTRQTAQMLRDNPQMTSGQLAQGRGVAEMFQKAAVVIGTPIAVCFVGFFVWVAGKIFGAAQGLKQAFMVATYSFFPRIIEGILNGIQSLLVDVNAIDSRYDITFSLARFLDNSAPVLQAAAGRIDVFVIWGYVLIALGLHITGNLPKNRAAMAAGLVWLVATLLAIWQGMRMA